MRRQLMATIIPDWLVELANKDDEIRRKLLTVKEDPEFLGVFIEQMSKRLPEEGQQSIVKLGAKAATALSKWAAAGFSRAPKDVIDKRLTACRACPKLVNSISGQAWMFVPENQREFCSMCGCPISRKASIVSEECPLPLSSDSVISRWGEPISGSSDV